MKSPLTGCKPFLLVIAAGLALLTAKTRAQAPAQGPATNEIRIVELQGTVEVFNSLSNNWVSAETNQVVRPSGRLRTGANSRMALRWSDQSVISFGALTELRFDYLTRTKPNPASTWSEEFFPSSIAINRAESASRHGARLPE